MDPMHSILIAAILHAAARRGAAAAFRIYWVVALWKEEIGSASAGAGFKEVVGDQKTIEHHYIYPSTSHGNAVSL